MLFTPVEIQETVNMFLRHKLDVRCITMGRTQGEMTSSVMMPHTALPGHWLKI